MGLSRRARGAARGSAHQLALFDWPTAEDGRSRGLSAPGPRQARARPARGACPSIPQHTARLEAPLGRHFERLYNAFRMRMFDSMGPRYGHILREAEREVRFLNPEFDTDALTEASAPAVLELIEAATRRAPFFQRAQLRKAACLLLSDLYEKQYELLAASGILPRLEEIYYRLKR